MRLASVIIAASILVLVIFGCSSSSNASGEFTTSYFINIDSSKTPQLETELVRSHGERALGLMYRKELSDSYGMLFVFPEEKPRSFWMKNTYVPLDMIFISSKMKVVSLLKGAKPLTTEARKSEKPATYVLEVKAGLVDTWKLKVGSTYVVTDTEKLVSY